LRGCRREEHVELERAFEDLLDEMRVAGTGFWFEGVKLGGRGEVVFGVELQVLVYLVFDEGEEDL
jgi:hypothetical protein